MPVEITFQAPHAIDATSSPRHRRVDFHIGIDYNINRQGPIPVYSFRGNSPTWTTTAPNVRSTPGPVVSNGKWLAIPSQGFSVLLDVETGEVVPGSYNSRSNIYLPESTTPIATMGRYDGNAAVLLSA